MKGADTAFVPAGHDNPAIIHDIDVIVGTFRELVYDLFSQFYIQHLQVLLPVVSIAEPTHRVNKKYNF